MWNMILYSVIRNDWRLSMIDQTNNLKAGKTKQTKVYPIHERLILDTTNDVWPFSQCPSELQTHDKTQDHANLLNQHSSVGETQ